MPMTDDEWVELAMRARGTRPGPPGDTDRQALNIRADIMGMDPSVVDDVYARREQQAAPSTPEERYEAYISGGARRFAGEAAGSMLAGMGMSAGPVLGTELAPRIGDQIPGETEADLKGRRSAQAKAASGLRSGIVEGLEGTMAEQQGVARRSGAAEAYFREPAYGYPDRNIERAVHEGAQADKAAGRAAATGRKAEVASRGQQSGWYDRVSRGLQGPRIPDAPRTPGGEAGQVGAFALPFAAGAAPLVQAGRELAKAGTLQDALVKYTSAAGGPLQTWHVRGAPILQELAADPAALEWAMQNGMLSDEVYAEIVGAPDMMAGG